MKKSIANLLEEKKEAISLNGIIRLKLYIFYLTIGLACLQS